jgi:Cof subfamily protein (haloacid dehalogenase superfamily)
MDGTLLNSWHKISGTSKVAIRRAHNKKIHIVVSTGRIYTDAEAYSNLIGVKSPIIASNGAVIRGIDMNHIIYKSAIAEQTCIRLTNILYKYNIKPNFNTPERVYFGSLSMKLFFEYLKLKGTMNNNIELKYAQSWKHLRNIICMEKDNIVKCEIINKNINKLVKIREELESIKEIEIVSSSKYNIEITNRGVSKGKAIEILASYYNIEKEEIIAIGDSENDLSMMEYASTGVAMGNAVDAVKKRARFITDSNDNDGVAKFINKFVCE